MEHICEHKGADQLRGDRISNQLFDFRFTGSTLPLPPFFLSQLMLLHSTVTVGPGRRSVRQVLS